MLSCHDMNIIIREIVYNSFAEAIIGGVIGTLITTLIIIIFSKYFNIIKKLRYKWTSWRTNPSLRVELSVPLSLKDPLPLNDFENKIDKILRKEILTMTHLPEATFKFSKKMDNFDIQGHIAPFLEEGQSQVEDFSFTIFTKNLKLKNLKNGLQGIQNFIFHDIFVSINRVMPIDIDNRNEGLTVYFETTPELIKFIDNINVKSITAQLKDLKIIVSKSNIRIHGKFENFEDISKIIAKNFIGS